jgi:hypothetical protein
MCIIAARVSVERQFTMHSACHAPGIREDSEHSCQPHKPKGASDFGLPSPGAASFWISARPGYRCENLKRSYSERCTHLAKLMPGVLPITVQ